MEKRIYLDFIIDYDSIKKLYHSGIIEDETELAVYQEKLLYNIILYFKQEIGMEEGDKYEKRTN